MEEQYKIQKEVEETAQVMVDHMNEYRDVCAEAGMEGDRSQRWSLE
jgi:hypothetical protein